MKFIVNSINTDIRSYPKIEFDSSMTAITFEGIHANALLLLNLLVRQGIVKMHQSDYQQFVKLYTQEQLQPPRSKHFPFSHECLAPIYTSAEKLALIDIIGQYNKLINCIDVINQTTLIRLLGDELVAEGVNDYFVLKLLSHLHVKGARYEILLSAHNIQFIEACELKAIHLIELVGDRINSGHSMFAMKELIDFDALKSDVVLNIYQETYKKHLKLISYCLDSEHDEIHVFSYSKINLRDIQELAEFFKVEFVADCATDLAATLDSINRVSLKNLNARTIRKMSIYDQNRMRIGINGIFANVIWRGGDFKSSECIDSKFNLKFIHQHNIRKYSEETASIESMFGQYMQYEGQLEFYSTNGQQAIMPIPLKNYWDKLKLIEEKSKGLIKPADTSLVNQEMELYQILLKILSAFKNVEQTHTFLKESSLEICLKRLDNSNDWFKFWGSLLTALQGIKIELQLKNVTALDEWCEYVNQDTSIQNALKSSSELSFFNQRGADCNDADLLFELELDEEPPKIYEESRYG